MPKATVGAKSESPDHAASIARLRTVVNSTMGEGVLSPSAVENLYDSIQMAIRHGIAKQIESPVVSRETLKRR